MTRRACSQTRTRADMARTQQRDTSSLLEQNAHHAFARMISRRGDKDTSECAAQGAYAREAERVARSKEGCAEAR